LLSLIACSGLIAKFLIKSQKFPIIIYLADDPVYVSDIPFPAVTFCPEILTQIADFDYNQIVEDIKHGLISIKDLNEKE
jgi:Amiloride-sensitive sodium channel